LPHSVSLADITAYLDDFLQARVLPDSPNALNGLQVENSGHVQRIVAAVDASQATIDGLDAAEGTGSPLLLVHHGLFWDGNVPLTGRRMRRVRGLIGRDAALYGAHIPLDLHPEVGNNAVLARGLSLDVRDWFGDYRGVKVGVWGEQELPRTELVDRLNRLLETQAMLIPGGPEVTRRVGIITGGAGNMIAEARDAGLDTFITGEGAHHTYFDAMEWGLNVIYAGHYATERVGVQALAAHLSRRFDLPWTFLDFPTGL
jgi:dinuclear metal center YbgI/SA1388 family protein